MSQPTLLTIAGFDPSSGAGLTADLQVFQAHGCFGIAAQTAYTVQSTRGVEAVHPVPATRLQAQLECLAVDLPPTGIKIGMLATAQNVQAVADFLMNFQQPGGMVPVVLDPLLLSSSGARLLSLDGLAVLRAQLLPLTTIVTPNWVELVDLTGLPVSTRAEAEQAACRLAAEYPGLTVAVTGGDLAEPWDLILPPTGEAHWLPGLHIASRATHGTGCAYSSALLCALMRGADVVAAAEHAKRFVTNAIGTAQPHGSGKGPMNLLWPLNSSSQ